MPLHISLMPPLMPPYRHYSRRFPCRQLSPFHFRRCRCRQRHLLFRHLRITMIFSIDFRRRRHCWLTPLPIFFAIFSDIEPIATCCHDIVTPADIFHAFISPAAIAAAIEAIFFAAAIFCRQQPSFARRRRRCQAEPPPISRHDAAIFTLIVYAALRHYFSRQLFAFSRCQRCRWPLPPFSPFRFHCRRDITRH